MKQYPHTLKATIKQAPKMDENGDYDFSDNSEEFVSKCRAEANGSGNLIKGDDGSDYCFSYAIYMPKTSTFLPHGTEIEVEGLFKGKIKRMSVGFFNVRLWV